MKQFFLALFVCLLPMAIRGQEPRPAPIPPPQRAPGQKFIEEVWHELETRTHGRPTFEELAATHEGATFEQLWEIARQQNPSIRQKMNQVAAAVGASRQAGLYPNPTVTYSGDNLGVNHEIGKHGLAVSQELVTSKKKKLDRAVASLDVEAARRNYHMECQRVRNDLRIAHCRMIHAELIVKIEEYCLQLSRNLLESAQKLQAEGKTRPVDVIQFRTALNSAALTLRQAQNDERSAWKEIASLLGDPEMPYRPVQGTLLAGPPERDWESTWAQFQQESPQLAVARLRVRQAKTYLARQTAERVSNVSATFQLSRDVPAETTVPFVGISMPLKIHDRNQGNIARAQAEVAVATREVQRLTLGFHQELARLFRDYENARLLVETYEDSIIPDCFEALSQINETYKKGELTYLELYNQRSAVMSILVQYVDALKTRAVSTALMDGMMLQGSLN